MWKESRKQQMPFPIDGRLSTIISKTEEESKGIASAVASDIVQYINRVDV